MSRLWPWNLALLVAVGACAAPQESKVDEAWRLLRTRCAPPKMVGVLAPAAVHGRSLGECSLVERQLAVALLQQGPRVTPNAETNYRAGVAFVYESQWRQAEVALGKSTAAAGATAAVWNDLAVVYLQVAESERGADDLVRALDAVTRARDLENDLYPIATNAALVRQQLGIGEWTQPSREERVAALARDSQRTSWKSDLDLLAEVVERRWTYEWANATLADDVDGARHWLLAMRRAADAVADAGDDSVQAMVDELTQERGGVDSRRLRASAWVAFVEAAHLFEEDRVAAAENRLSAAATTLGSAGPAVSARAVLLQAAIDRVLGRTEASRRAVAQGGHVGFRRHQELEARRAWQLGLLLTEAGDLGGAHSQFTRARAVTGGTGDRETDAMVASLLAANYADLQDWGAAWNLQIEANRQVGHSRRLRRESIRTNAALMASAMGLYRAAAELRAPALVEAKTIGSPSSQGFLMIDEALDRFRAGDARAAEDLLEDAEAAALRVDDAGTGDMLAVLQLTTRAEVVAGKDPERAQALLARAVALSRSRLSEYGTVDALLRRARLLQQLGRASEAEDVYSDGLRTSRAQESSLAQPALADDLRSARWELYRGLAGLWIDRGEPWRAFDLVETSRRERDGRTADARRAPDSPGNAQPMLVSVLELDGRSAVWVVQGHSREAYRIERDSSALAAMVEQVRKDLRQDRVATPEARALFDAIFGPIRSRLRTAPSLVVCADGPLARLPFGALLDSTDDSLVVEQLPVAVSTECRSDAVRRRTRAPKGGLAVLVGDATPNRDAERLPRSLHETREIGALYPGALLIVGRDATRERVTETAGKAEVLHFSGHALAHPSKPRLSRLVLSPAGEDEDGALYASQIERLRLKAQLVVLAACDSATGAQRPGAGVTGLAAAFLAAGAQAVVATQWAVPDVEAARFFVEFHRRYTLSGDHLSALRDTQLWARRQRMPASMWAAVVSLERAT